MSLKYRIRVSADRVIGPFSKEEIAELFEKKHINGSEDCQLFPVGDWKNILTVSTLAEVFQKKVEDKVEPAPISEEQKSLNDSQAKLFQEFKFNKEEQQHVDYSELEKKYQEEKPSEEPASEPVPEMEKTVVQKRSQAADVDKTVIDIKKASIPIKEDPQAPKSIPAAMAKEKTVVVQTREERVNEKTQVIDLKSILPTINTEVRVAEIDFEQQENIEENQEKVKLREVKNSKKEATKEAAKKKVGMKPIIAIAFAAIIYMLLNPDEPPPSVAPIYSKINFPITLEYEDASKASLALQKGKEAYAANTYKARLLAANYFSESLQHQFRSNESLGELILTYAELLDNTKDEKQASNVIYKLIMLSENKTFSDVKVVTGSALFYFKIGKFQTGINLIKNFFRAKGKATPKLLGYYLDLLMSAGDFTEATKIAVKLNEIPKKPFESYLSLARYFEIDEKIEYAQTMAEEGLKLYPASVPLLIRLADFYLKNNSLEKFESVLVKVKKLNSEFSPVYTAKYYKHMGFLAAAKNKNKEAAAYFKKSLEIYESDELRSILASLEIKGDKFSQALILESKIIDLMKRANSELRNRNYEAASTFSVEAVDADPDYVPAVLQHVQIQINRGLYDAAIFSLNRILDKQPTNTQIKKMIIETYISALKFDDAQKELIELSKTKFAYGGVYASLMGKFFEAKKLYPLTIRWYTEALTRNPLSDADMFSLAQVYFKLKKFEEAKKQLSKALTLDPKNVEYIALQAEIFNDQDNADVALGYLRDSITEMGEDPLLISTIAKIYYKSGQLKEFQTYYKKILAMPKKDEKFFEFLIYAAKLEDSKTDFITYSNELLKIHPGHLALQMELAEFYMKNGNTQDAFAHLLKIEEKLKSYPRLHYLLAKLALMQGDLPRAKEMAEKEKQYNPTLEHSFVMLGDVAKAQREFREAFNLYEKALSLNPKCVDALLAMGSIKLSQNHGSEALDLLLLALKHDKNNPEISKQLGFAYRAAGQRSQGRERFEDYLKLNPGAQDREQIEALIRSLK